MDLNIGTVDSRIEVTDATALLSPAVLRRIVEAVQRALQNEQNVQERRDAEVSLQNRVADAEI